MLAIEQFYETFAAHGLLDRARIRYAALGRQDFFNGTFHSTPFDQYNLAEDSSPTFKCLLSSIPDVSHGDELHIKRAGQQLFDTDKYVVVGIGKPDNRGEVVLKLALRP